MKCCGAARTFIKASADVLNQLQVFLRNPGACFTFVSSLCICDSADSQPPESAVPQPNYQLLARESIPTFYFQLGARLSDDHQMAVELEPRVSPKATDGSGLKLMLNAASLELF